MFEFHLRTQFGDVTDGTSNTFAIGERASRFEMCEGIGCLTPLSTGDRSALRCLANPHMRQEIPQAQGSAVKAAITLIFAGFLAAIGRPSAVAFASY